MVVKECFSGVREWYQVIRECDVCVKCIIRVLNRNIQVLGVKESVLRYKGVLFWCYGELSGGQGILSSR